MSSGSLSGLLFIGCETDRGRHAPLVKASGGAWSSLAQCDPERLARASVLVVDVPLATVRDVQALRRVLRMVSSDVPRLIVVDKAQRVELVNASIIGATAVAHRPLEKSDLRTFLSRQAGRVRTSASNEASVRSGAAAAGSLENLFQSVTADVAPDQAMLEAAGDEIAAAISDDGLGRWLETVRTHHHGTLQHCIIVAGVLTRFGQGMGMSRADVSKLTQIGLLHDVGKAAIPTEILDKPGRLTEEEFAVIKTHPYRGFKFLREHGEVTPDVLDAVVGHHEYLDGSGYPYGLSGPAIGDLARLTTVCDVYAALTERRSYKKEMQPAEALAVLDDMAQHGKVERTLVVALRQVLGTEG